MLLFVFDPLTSTTVYLLAVAGALAGTRLRVRTLLLAHLPSATFAAGLLLVNAVNRSGHVVWYAGVLHVTVEGLSLGAALAMRTLAIGVLAIPFVSSTDPVTLVTSLHEHARLSARTTYAILAGYRMLQELPREWETIRQAPSPRRPGSAAPRRQPPPRTRTPGPCRLQPSPSASSSRHHNNAHRDPNPPRRHTTP